MTAVTAGRVLCAVALLSALAGAPSLNAQIEIGTWVRQAVEGPPGMITMTVEVCCGGSGRRITFGGGSEPMTVESQLDGREASMLLGGTLSGLTMAITRIDDHHAVTVIAWNGQPSRRSKATLSADGRDNHRRE